MPKSTLLYAAAAMALGLIGIVWDAFAFLWQPFPPGMPFYSGGAYLAGAALVLGGAGLLIRGTSNAAGWALAAVLVAFSVPWAIRVVRFPQLFGTWGGFAEEFSMATAAIVLALSRAGRQPSAAPTIEAACIKLYGACAVAFGLNHFFALPQTASMVPEWIPPGGMFWAVATGVFHAGAGIAIIGGLRAALAARLLGLMMLGFSALIWLPNLEQTPAAHMTWAGNAVNLLLAGAAFVIADAIERRRRDPDRAGAQPASSKERGGSPLSATGS